MCKKRNLQTRYRHSSALRDTVLQKKAPFRGHMQQMARIANTSSTAAPPFQMIGRTSPTPEEMKPNTNNSNPCVILTENGTGEAQEEATAYNEDSNIFICVKLVEDSPAVCHSGLFREKMELLLLWEGNRPTATDQKRTTFASSP